MSGHRENIQRVRDLIAGLPPERFDMRALWSAAGEVAPDYGKTPAALVKGCGTAACIAGWTLALLKPRTKGLDSNDAGNLLGLNEEEADLLFMPPGFMDEARFTQAMAVRTLDHLLATGEVAWKLPLERSDA